MKTTLIIPDPVMEMARKEAARLNVTISQLVEDALRLFLNRTKEPQELEPLPTWNGGIPRFDLSNQAALRDLLDQEKYERLYGPDRDTRPWSDTADLPPDGVRERQPRDKRQRRKKD